MAEDIKSFIEKIQQEGVKAAEEKARQIEEEAKVRVEQILREAGLKADEITREAKEKIAKTEASQKILLKQAGRDFLFTLRQEINALLQKLILAKVKEALTPQVLSEIIARIIKEALKADNKAEITVTFNPDDLAKIKQNLHGTLAEEVRKGIVLKAQDEIRAGFLISYDAGKSQFDFSDKSLADFIASSIKPQLEDLLKDESAQQV